MRMQDEFYVDRHMVQQAITIRSLSLLRKILSKLEWAKDSRSSVQFGDVRNLLRSVETLDKDYLTYWASRLGLMQFYREVCE
jgi:hypothetical protein